MSRIFTVSVASVYPHYVAKLEKKGRTEAELEQVIAWLTGFDAAALRAHLDAGTTFEEFFAAADLNPDVSLITGVVCGIRVEDVEDPLMQKIRYLDKLVDELARGRRWRRCCGGRNRASCRSMVTTAGDGRLQRRRRAMSVLLLGDSHLARFRPYGRLVARDCTVRAVGGATASDLLDQLGDLDPAAFDVIAVSVGSNDCCRSTPTELPSFLHSIQTLVERVAPTPVLMVNNPGVDARATDHDGDKMRHFAAQAGALVRSRGGRALDTARLIAPLGRRGRATDGLHISKAAHLLLVPALRVGIRRTS